MELCVVSFKNCWQDEAGRWWSYGGFPLQMAAIASLFDRVTLVVVASGPRAGGLPLPPDARVVPLRSPRSADTLRKLSVLSRLDYYLRVIATHVRQADVVHVPVPGDISLLGLLVALLLRKPLIARYGSSWAHTPQTTVMQRATRAIMRASAGGRNVMLATGDGAASPAPGMHWVFATALSRPELETIVPVPDRRPGTPARLVYAGRLSAEKGVAHLVGALTRIRRSGAVPVPVVTLVGDGPQRPALEALVRASGCSEHVSFAGHVDRVDLVRHLQSADLCVQPSLTEGFSKAWLDAMAVGLPVVTSDVGAASSVVGGPGERGWLVPPGDDAALAAVLTRVLRDEAIDWPVLRRRCRAFVEGRTLEAWAERIADICAAQWGVTRHEGKLRGEGLRCAPV